MKKTFCLFLITAFIMCNLFGCTKEPTTSRNYTIKEELLEVYLINDEIKNKMFDFFDLAKASYNKYKTDQNTNQFVQTVYDAFIRFQDDLQKNANINARIEANTESGRQLASHAVDFAIASAPILSLPIKYYENPDSVQEQDILSAMNNISQYFCGVDVLKSDIPERTEATETTENIQASNEMIINKFKEDLQGYWVLKENDYIYVISFDFEHNEIKEGFYLSGAQTFQINHIMLENDHSLAIDAHCPGIDDPFDPIPAQYGVYNISFTSTERIEISVSFNNNEPVYFQYAGKTQASLDAICKESNEEQDTDNSIINTEITANTWYRLTNNNVVHFQNASIKYAVPLSNGSGFMISYYPICRSCHTQDEIIQMAAVDSKSPISESHYCQSCGTTTYIHFKLVY